MLIIGADISLTHSVFHTSTGRKFEICGELKKGKKAIHAHPVARLDFLAARFESELAACTLDVEAARHLFLENYSMGSKWGREALGEWGGQVRRIAYRAGFEIVLVPPASLKKFVAGSGKQEKDGMRMHVLDRWHYKSADNDDADAFALLKLGENVLDWRGGAAVPRYVAELFAKLEAWSADSTVAGQASVGPEIDSPTR